MAYIEAAARWLYNGRRGMGNLSTSSEMRFGRYRVVGQLGAGAMAQVYRAHDETLGRDVAIKVVQTAYLGPFAAEQFRARFATEARVVAGLSHPNIVAVHDIGVEDGKPFLVMELAEGASLKQRLEQGTLSCEEVRLLGAQIAGALAAAHKSGIVHRDVKPANLLQARPGLWKLADFGVAHAPDSELTITGQFVGSPAYAAPEALSSGEMGPACDIYGLGATMWTALVGKAPYADRKTGAFGAGGPPDLTAERPDVPPPLAQAISAALTIDPDGRPTAAALLRALEQTTAAPPAGRPTPVPMPMVAPGVGTEDTALAATSTTVLVAEAERRRRRRIAAAVGGGVLLLLIIAIAASGSDSHGPPRPRPAPAFGASGVLAAGDSDGEEPVMVGNYPREGKNADRMAKALEKLDAGNYREAAKKLREILRDDPDDYEARALYDQVAPYADDNGPPGHRGRGKKRGHRD